MKKIQILPCRAGGYWLIFVSYGKSEAMEGVRKIMAHFTKKRCFPRHNEFGKRDGDYCFLLEMKNWPDDIEAEVAKALEER